ncbi:hypothetical protein D9611_015148 [Ephemerocybe angulata]|uniref:Histone deacetylase complex subunit SAP18 n=1 Tax=Ephemerocybe angulata TaxID=980116 RepID=A0A8H5B6H5_9AGAR|nr:hypothetical protein D9611_015148 [Tulosesus angulatus]
MDVDHEPAGPPLVSRDKTAPFLIRTFAKVGGFHRLGLFEDGTLPTTDEHQLFTWRDATLREVLTTLRNTSRTSTRSNTRWQDFSFRTVYADSTNKGRFASKELGQVYSRDILGEPGSLASTAPRLLQDDEQHPGDALSQREKEERTLEELRFVPGDYLCVSVLLPKSAGAPAELAIKGSGANAAVPSAGWKTGGERDGRGTGLGAGAPRGAGGHWRGGRMRRGRRGEGLVGGVIEIGRGTGTGREIGIGTGILDVRGMIGGFRRRGESFRLLLRGGRVVGREGRKGREALQIEVQVEVAAEEASLQRPS